MANIILTLVIVSIIGLAIFKVVRDKRKGVKCIGCALSGEGCTSNKGANKKTRKIDADLIDIKELT